MVSDTQLAAGWMYADVVHADVQGWKAKALAFSLHERYAAATSVFSRIAALTVSTLRLVEHLRREGVVVVDDQMWDEDVVVGVTEIVYEGTAYTAEPGTEMPAMIDLVGQPGGPWTQLTVTDSVRSDPTNRVLVELGRADGSRVAAYEAAVVHRRNEEEVLHWHVLVAESIIFQVQLRVEGERVAPQAIDKVFAAENRRTLLAANNFLLQMYQAQTLSFRMQEKVLVSCRLDSLTPDALLPLRANIELLEDVLAIEEFSEQEIGPFIRKLTLFERVRLRQTHLLWRGKIVQWDRALPNLVSPVGITPEAVRIEPTDFDAGGAQVRTPEILVGHPEAAWHDEGPVPEAGPAARRYAATIPDNVRFLAWSPQTRLTSSNEEPTGGESWNLPGIDQDDVPF